MSDGHFSSQTMTSAVPLRHLSPNRQLRIPSQGDVDNRLNDEGVKANPVFSLQQSIPQEPIDLSSDSPSGDDLGSTYRAEDVGESLDSLDEFLDGLERETGGPSRQGLGKGKDLRFCDSIIQERVARMERGEVDEEEEDNEFFGSSSKEGEDTAIETGSNNIEGQSPGEVLSQEANQLPHYNPNYSSPKNHPYSQGVDLNEVDFEYDPEDTEKDKVAMRRSYKIISCASLASDISKEEIMWLVEYFDVNARWMKPTPEMRIHRFNIEGLYPPRMVITNRLVELGFGNPMHPFLIEIFEYHRIAPIQLSPNSYRLAIGLYMMYINKGYEPPTMEELSYFVSLRQSGGDTGFYYYTIFTSHGKTGLSAGNPSNMKHWKKDFFYLYDVPRVRTKFNLNPCEYSFGFAPIPPCFLSWLILTSFLLFYRCSSSVQVIGRGS